MSTTSLRDFGYCESVRPHCLEVIIGTHEVTFVENPHIRRRVGQESTIEKAILPIASWKRISQAAAKELNDRIAKDEDLKKCPKAKWNKGLNNVDLVLGRELLVLVWAVEQLESEPESIDRVLVEWLELSPEDRFFFYRLTNAFTGRSKDRESFRRRGLAYVLMGNERDLLDRAKLSRDLDVKKKSGQKQLERSSNSSRGARAGKSSPRSTSKRAKSMRLPSKPRCPSSSLSTTRKKPKTLAIKKKAEKSKKPPARTKILKKKIAGSKRHSKKR